MQTEIGEQKTKLSQQQSTLKNQLRQAYLLGQDPYLKVLLNQENPSKTNRMLKYYDYLNRDRTHIIQELNKTLATISSHQSQQMTQQQSLRNTYQQLAQEQQQLSSLNKKRRSLVNHLGHEIHNKRQRLDQLQSQKQQLEKTLKQLAKASPSSSGARQLIRLKGQLAWPTQGPLIQSFGMKIGKSELQYDGVLIKAPEGQPIHAIASGKVVFAKWLPGYGLLIIIDHGAGYMSLYGRVRNVYKKIGDKIKQGKLIGTVGTSGGYLTPSLYFAIRHNAKPLNPKQWCQKTVS